MHKQPTVAYDFWVRSDRLLASKGLMAALLWRESAPRLQPEVLQREHQGPAGEADMSGQHGGAGELQHQLHRQLAVQEYFRAEGKNRNNLAWDPN